MRAVTIPLACAAAAALLAPAPAGAQEARRAPLIGPWAAGWAGYTAYSLRAGAESSRGGGAWGGAAAGVRFGRRAFVGVQAQGFDGWLTETATRGASLGVLAGGRLAADRRAALLAYGGLSRERFRSDDRFAGTSAELGLALEAAPRWAVSPLLLVGRRWWLAGEEERAVSGAPRRAHAGQRYVVGLGVSVW